MMNDLYKNHHAVVAKLNFVNPSEGVIPRVTYSGTSTPQNYNEAYVMQEVSIANARVSAKKFKLHENGFEIARLTSSGIDFCDEKSITSNYYREVEQLVKRVSGASHVFIFDHTVRRGVANSVRKPAQHIHVDYTKNTGPSRAADMIDSAELEALKGKRFIQVTVWRSISGPVEELPLTVMDTQSLREEDLVLTEIEYKDKSRLGEIYALRRHPDQHWYYYPDMQSDEVLLFKGYDSDESSRSGFIPHTAFEDPTSKPDAQPRQSIEIRTFAFYD